MSDSFNPQQLKSDLMPHWSVVGATLSMLAAYVYICHYTGTEWQQGVSEQQRVVIRTIFYILTIIGFPLINLLRHIQLRLNQTMPGPKPAKNRYFLTILISMTLAESIGVMGLVMYILGDDFNTFYIFIVLSTLAVFLYRPKISEYRAIIEALADHDTNSKGLE